MNNIQNTHSIQNYTQHTKLHTAYKIHTAHKIHKIHSIQKEKKWSGYARLSAAGKLII